MMGKRILEWWKSALVDLRMAEDHLKRGWHADSCFHAQQAAEKALKTFLIANERMIRTHDLLELSELARKHGLVLEIDVGDLRKLSDQYSAPRYPNFRLERGISLEDYTAELAEWCLNVARRIVEEVEKWLREKGFIERGSA